MIRNGRRTKLVVPRVSENTIDLVHGLVDGLSVGGEADWIALGSIPAAPILVVVLHKVVTPETPIICIVWSLHSARGDTNLGCG
jgi:hypothetical protein